MEGVKKKTLHEEAWAQVYPLTDRQLSPLGLQAMAALALHAGGHVLDVGCGTGQSLLQLVERVGPTGQVVGVDVSRTFLAIAKERTQSFHQIKLIEADAQTVSLPNGSLDAVFSRFGIMAFEDPAAAFANFQKMLKPEGTLGFCCWAELQDNELDLLPLEASGMLARVDQTPFSFSEPVFIRKILKGAGFHDIAITPHKVPVSCGGIEETMDVLLRVGALGKIVREDPDLRPQIEPLLRKVLIDRSGREHVHLTASIFVVTASA
ncbi:methyltransferase domain-containing protein [Roseibium porphyridii]|uniref:Methyltransferase domain-containing protein n=1 Tax=Roseibium porphyridii TaxID=2866279 RepID=A0ABY8FHL1_9HYPH|nr:methyltransferase domain-containing protein [Roseibium sp. KMA01]WFE92058.1 methyltransferase domain-containing protein [Roseibium sp. KMA01]